MIRYISSFFISLSVYSVLAISIFYLYANTEINVLKNKNIENKKISLKHVNIKKKIQSKKVSKKILETKLDKKIIKNLKKVKKSKKIKKQKKKKITKKVLRKKKIRVKKNIKPKLIAKIQKAKKYTLIEKKEVVIPVKSKQETIPKKNEKKEFLRKHLYEIRALINKNIKYPRRARKLHIEGIVKAKFKLFKNGRLSNISILKGHKFLKKATIKAIKKASYNFPKTLSDIEIIVPIEFKLT